MQGLALWWYEHQDVPRERLVMTVMNALSGETTYDWFATAVANDLGEVSECLLAVSRPVRQARRCDLTRPRQGGTVSAGRVTEAKSFVQVRLWWR